MTEPENVNNEPGKVRLTKSIDICPWNIPEIDRFPQASRRVQFDGLAPPLIILQERAGTQNDTAAVLKIVRCCSR